jgi:hypothetical protein
VGVFATVSVLLQLFALLGTVLGTFLLPVIYFFVLGYLWDKKRVKTLEAFIWALAFPITVASFYVIVGLICSFSYSWYITYVITAIVCEMLDCLIIFGNVGFVRLVGGKRIYALSIVIQAIAMLGMFGAQIFCLWRIEAWYKPLNDGEFWTLLFPLLIIGELCLYSIVLGRIMSGKHMVIKMLVWYFGIFAAIFFGFSNWESLDFKSILFNVEMVTGGLPLSAFIWGFTFIGFGLSRIQTGKAENKE